MNITIAILTYNEEKTLNNVVKEVYDVLTTIKGNHEILIINDGSRDNTGKVATKLAKQLDWVKVVEHSANMGLGAAYRTGFSEASGDLLTFWPADGQFDPSIIKKFYLLMDNHDLILGYLPNRKREPAGRILSFGEKALYRILFGKLPRFQGVLMLRRHLLNDIKLISKGRGWAIIIEFIIKASRGNYRIKSVATNLRPRLNGKSKVTNIKTILSNLYQILELRVKL
jgi:glycosyltransferase involved in cell wall biosynthesis